MKKTWIQKLKEKQFLQGMICCLILIGLIFLLIEFVPIEMQLRKNGYYNIKTISTPPLPGNLTIINQTYEKIIKCSEPRFIEDSPNRTYLDCGYGFMEGVEENITNEDMDYCKNLKYLHCVNKLFDDWEGNRSCVEREPQTVSETVKTKNGCCKDAAKVYEFFLNKQNITNQNILVPGHVFNLAILEMKCKNMTMKKYYVLDQGFMDKIWN